MTSLNSKLQLAVLNRKKGRNLLEKGFTLVELMIVIVIVGILSSVALPNFLNQTKKARATEAVSAISASYKNAQQLYLEDPEVSSMSCPEVSMITDSNNIKSAVCTYDKAKTTLRITATTKDDVIITGTIDVATGTVTKPVPSSPG